MCDESEWSWFHVILTTYGAWLPGDERGYRLRKHRGHVDGDYKNPPPSDQYQELRRYSKLTLKQDAVSLTQAQRKTVGDALKGKLEGLGSTVACLAIAKQHGHLLVKLPKTKTRLWVGHAKRHAWFEMREAGWTKKLWAKRPKFVPIQNRAHQLNVYRYILAHAEAGAYTWKHSDGA